MSSIKVFLNILILEENIEATGSFTHHKLWLECHYSKVFKLKCFDIGIKKLSFFVHL